MNENLRAPVYKCINEAGCALQKRGTSMVDSKHYEKQAMNWINSGRPDNLLIKDLPLAALRCWHGFHTYVKTPDISPAIGEYLSACEAKLPENWYETVLWQRAYCAICSQTYKIENMKICTGCHEVYCYSCASQGARDENNYSLCRCGAELTG